MRRSFGHRPLWTEAFVKELMDQPDELLIGIKKRSSRSMIALSVASLLGFVSQAITLLYLPFQFTAALLSTSWVSLFPA